MKGRVVDGQASAWGARGLPSCHLLGRQLKSERAPELLSEALGSSLHFALTEAMTKMGHDQPPYGVCESDELMDTKASHHGGAATQTRGPP